MKTDIMKLFSKSNFLRIRKNSIETQINYLYETKQINKQKQNELLKLLNQTNLIGNEYRRSNLFKQLSSL